MKASLARWFSAGLCRTQKPAVRRKTSCKLQLEALEDRAVPTAGALDPSFGIGGQVTTDMLGSRPGDNTARAVQQADGKIIVAGRADSNVAVLRYNGDGSLDNTFGSNGHATIDFGASWDEVFGVALDGAGNVIVAGRSYQGGSTGYDFAVARLDASGQLDSTFDGDGKRTIDFGSSNDIGYGVAVDGAGNVIIAGYSYQGGSTGWDFAVARLDGGGQLDSAFDGDGKQTIDFGSSDDIGYGVAVDGAGNVIVAGRSYQGGSTGYDFAVARLTAGGQLDSGFDGDGKRTIDFGSFNDFGYSGVALDNVGNVVVAGYSYQPSTGAADFAVARLDASGQLDSTFDGDGKQTIDFGSSYDIGYGVAVDGAGNVIVAGHSYQGGSTGYDFAVARLDASGQLDSTFDGDGRAVTEIPAPSDDWSDLSAIAVQPDGKIVVAGMSSQFQNGTGNDFTVVRYCDDGALDPSFGTNGRVTIDFGSSNDYGFGVAVDAAGNIIVAGYSAQGGSTGTDFAVARLDASGQLDSTFDGDGKQTIDFGSLNDYGFGVAVDGTGNVIVTGYSYHPSTGGDFAVARLDGSGQLDNTFDGDGKQTIDFGSSSDVGFGVALDSAGNVIVAGYSYHPSTGTDFAVARLDASGQLDSTFDGDGKQTIDFGSSDDIGYGVAVDGAGNVIVAGRSYQGGSTGNDFAVARLDSSGQLDSAFDGDGKQTIDFGSFEDYGHGVALDSAGNVIVVGASYQGGSTAWDFAVARLDGGGQLDSTFDGDGKQTVDFGPDDWAMSVAVQPDDKILVAGGSSQPGTNYDFAVARLLANGNTAPVALSQSTAVPEDGAVAITLGGADAETAEAQLLFTITAVPSTGTLYDGARAVQVGDTFTGPPTLQYVPGAGCEATEASLSFTVTDPEGLVSAPATVTIAIEKAVADGTIILSDGILRVGGTAGNDVVSVSGGALVVNGISHSLTGVTEIRIWARGGADRIDLTGTTLKSFIHAGDGNDIVTGGSGDDVILGGKGNDDITGGSGNDFLIGGEGTDRIVGSAGHDILLAGDVGCSVTREALLRAMLAWVSDRATDELATGEDEEAVITDDNYDMLTGSSGADLFYVDTGDKITDFKITNKDGDVVICL